MPTKKLHKLHRNRTRIEKDNFQHHKAILVAIISVILLVTLSVLVRMPATGRTALMDTPIVTPLNLDQIGESLIDVTVNPSFQTRLTTSNKENFVMNVQVEERENVMYYSLSIRNEIVAIGLLNSLVPTSGAIYV
ncbi:MAG: hypothetical protein ABIH82_01685, partial [Candidatus Woesearchaeota archaeon]